MEFVLDRRGGNGDRALVTLGFTSLVPFDIPSLLYNPVNCIDQPPLIMLVPKIDDIRVEALLLEVGFFPINMN